MLAALSRLLSFSPFPDLSRADRRALIAAAHLLAFADCVQLAVHRPPMVPFQTTDILVKKAFSRISRCVPDLWNGTRSVTKWRRSSGWKSSRTEQDRPVSSLGGRAAGARPRSSSRVSSKKALALCGASRRKLSSGPVRHLTQSKAMPARPMMTLPTSPVATPPTNFHTVPPVRVRWPARRGCPSSCRRASALRRIVGTGVLRKALSPRREHRAVKPDPVLALGEVEQTAFLQSFQSARPCRRSGARPSGSGRAPRGCLREGPSAPRECRLPVSPRGMNIRTASAEGSPAMALSRSSATGPAPDGNWELPEFAASIEKVQICASPFEWTPTRDRRVSHGSRLLVDSIRIALVGGGFCAGSRKGGQHRHKRQNGQLPHWGASPAGFGWRNAKSWRLRGALLKENYATSPRRSALGRIADAACCGTDGSRGDP